MATEDVRSLLVEADSFISHMHHRGSWPGDKHEVDDLIGRLRRTAERMRRGDPPAEPERERLPASVICELIAEASQVKTRGALLLAYYLDSADPAVAEAFIHAGTGNA